MKISVFGMGYVGVVTAACLCKEGHRVMGVDISLDKINLLNQGKSPIVEDKIEGLIQEAIVSGQLTATTDAEKAVDSTDMGIVCVGTPSNSNGSLDTQYLVKVVSQIGKLIVERNEPFIIVIRSTVTPGTIQKIVLPILTETYGNSVGKQFELLFHPEFLREGTSVDDFYDPPKIVIGEREKGAGKPLLDLYKGFSVPVFCTSYETAEMIKYADNIFHALKVTFANEIGQFCHAVGVNSQEVMETFCADKKLNLSSKYLRPGFAFGGSCLPKDLRAFLYIARKYDLSVPMLSHILLSNKIQIEQVALNISQKKPSRIGLCGLAFKQGTDDLRESPLVILAELLVGKGFELKIHDKFVEVSRLVGGNKSYIEQSFAHLSRLLVPSLEAFNDCDLIILGHSVGSNLIESWLECGKIVYDLTGSYKFSHQNFNSIT